MARLWKRPWLPTFKKPQPLHRRSFRSQPMLRHTWRSNNSTAAVAKNPGVNAPGLKATNPRVISQLRQGVGMFIKQVKHIGSVGRFRSCGAQGDVTLKKYTVVFGENGRGKTTLCAILRSLQTVNSDI